MKLYIKLIDRYNKGKKIIESCKTLDHLNGAQKFNELFNRQTYSNNGARNWFFTELKKLHQRKKILITKIQ